MSRDAWTDTRTETARNPGSREGPRERTPQHAARDVRQEVRGRDRTYRIRASEWRTLKTVGTFRVVADVDLLRDARDETVMRNDLRHLVEEGLLERKTGIVEHHPTRLVVLTREGKALLDRHRDPEAPDATQQYHVGLVKPRELAHDVQFYRAYQAEAARIEADGGHVTRVALDYELKRDYQTFLNRRDRSPEATVDEDRRTFAEARHLPILDGHLELPDLRLEYETADGRLETRDLEVVTEHYSRGQLSGKARAGFAVYRPASGGTTRGGTPLDPHTLDWLR